MYLEKRERTYIKRRKRVNKQISERSLDLYEGWGCGRCLQARIFYTPILDIFAAKSVPEFCFSKHLPIKIRISFEALPMRLWYLSHMRLAKVQASLRIRAVSPEPLLFLHMKYGGRPLIALRPLNSRACAFKVYVYGGPSSRKLAQWLLPGAGVVWGCGVGGVAY